MTVPGLFSNYSKGVLNSGTSIEVPVEVCLRIEWCLVACLKHYGWVSQASTGGYRRKFHLRNRFMSNLLWNKEYLPKTTSLTTTGTAGSTLTGRSAMEVTSASTRGRQECVGGLGSFSSFESCPCSCVEGLLYIFPQFGGGFDEVVNPIVLCELTSFLFIHL